MSADVIPRFERMCGEGYRVLAAELRRDALTQLLIDARESGVLRECTCCANDFELRLASEPGDDEIVAHVLTVAMSIDGVVQDPDEMAICCRCAEDWQLAVTELKAETVKSPDLETGAKVIDLFEALARSLASAGPERAHPKRRRQ